MATGGEEQVGYSLINVGTLTLRDTNKYSYYTSIVVCQDKIVVINFTVYKVQIYRLHDGKFLATTDRLESIPRDLCLMDAMTICVLHKDGLIKMMSIDSTDVSRDLKTTRSLRLQGILDDYRGVVRFKDNLVVSGAKQGRMYWCVVSLDDGHVDTIHEICKGDGWNYVTTKDNMIYISCWADSISSGTLDISFDAGYLSRINTGVYGFDILNPSQCKYTYKHRRLQVPTSIVINEDGNIFVCGNILGVPLFNCIHQLTASCQLIAIFTLPLHPLAMFLDHGRLYVTSNFCSDITVFQPVYQGTIIPVEILRMDNESLLLYKKALKDGKEKVYNIRVMVVGQFGVGKTTLTKRLLGEQVDISERKSTEGIDVYKHYCKIALDTGEWTVQRAITEHNYQLQRLASVLIEKQSVSEGFPDEEVALPSQGERTSDGNASITDKEQVMSSPQEGRSLDNKASVTYKEQVKIDPGNEMLIPGSNANVTADIQVIILPQGEINPDSGTNVADKEKGLMDPIREKLISDTNANFEENIQVIIQSQGEITPDSIAYVADTEQVKKDPMREMLILLRGNTYQLKHDKGKVSPLSIWDFAGHYAFYTTHQAFLTRRAIYLLVLDVSGQVTDIVADECFFDSEGITKCRVHEMIDVWLNSIHSCALSSEAGIPPVILVGTHLDKITQIQLPSKGKELEMQRPTIFQSVKKIFNARKTKETVEATPVSSITDQPKKKRKWRFWQRTKKDRFDADTEKTCKDKYPTPVGLEDHNYPETLIALCDYTRSEPEELSILKGDELILVDKSLEGFGWWKVRNSLGEVGLVPFSFVQSYRYELCSKYFREIRSYLRDKPTRLHLVDEDFAIDNTISDQKLEDLKRKIVQVASQQPYWGEEIPARWIPLEQDLMNMKESGIKVIPLTMLEDLNKAGAVPIAADELDLFLRFHHDIGTILYFSLKVFKEYIVLDPQWMIDALKSLITAEEFILKSALAIADKWYEFKQKGKLYPELIDAVWSEKKNPDFHDNKEHILRLMERLNIIAKPRYYSEDWSEIKVESYFLAPCMLSERTPTEVINLAQHPERGSSSVLCYVFQGKFLPAPIFHRLLATCVAHWPIAKKMSENLIFCGCCVFNIDLHHRLTMFFRDYIIFLQVTRMGATEKNPSSKLCIDVQKFTTLTLSSIIGHLGQSLRFDLFIQCPRIIGYRADCLIPVNDLKGNVDVPCHFHDISHVIMSCDVLKFWFQETGYRLEEDLSNLRLEDYAANQNVKQQQIGGTLFGSSQATQAAGFNIGITGGDTGSGTSRVSCSDPELLYQVLKKSTQVFSSSRSTLEGNCQTMGLKFHGETPGNGNCFFEAVSSQLQRLNCAVQKSQQQLRQDVVDFMKSNTVLQVSEGTINLAEFIPAGNFNDYCERMAQDGEWADHVVVVGMARMLQRDIMIVTSAPSSGPENIIAWVVGQTNFNGQPILLGHVWENHYQSLQPIGDPKSPGVLGSDGRKQLFIAETSEKSEQGNKTNDPVEQIYSRITDLTASEKRKLFLPPGKKYHAFFSYASPDIQWVKETVERLENDHGFVCREYDRDNTPGTLLLSFAADSIKYAIKTVVVMTKEAFKSGFVEHEIQMALQQGFETGKKCVVPVLVQDCTVPDYLRILNYVDARDPTQRDIWWPKLLTELLTRASKCHGD